MFLSTPFRGFDLVAHTIHTGGQHRGEGEVGVAGRVRAAELRPGAVAARQDADQSGRCAADDAAWRLVARDEPLVGVDRGVREPGDGTGMFSSPPMKWRQVSEIWIGASGSRTRFAVFCKRAVGVHPLPQIRIWALP